MTGTKCMKVRSEEVTVELVDGMEKLSPCDSLELAAGIGSNSEMFTKIMSNILDLAEATGRFRRLVREEDIDWQSPWEVITTHPRHKEIL